MIVIIDNYDSFTYNLYQAVAIIHPDVKVVRNDKITVDEVAAERPQGIIISPGPGRPEKAGIGIELIKKLGNKIPILGICLGHQMIAMAYGGKVTLANQPMHGKNTSVFHSRQDIYKDMPFPFQAARYHSLIVEKESLPDNLLIESKNDNGMLMGIRHRQYPVYGFQFHPESILTPEGNILIRNFLEKC